MRRLVAALGAEAEAAATHPAATLSAPLSTTHASTLSSTLSGASAGLRSLSLSSTLLGHRCLLQDGVRLVTTTFTVRPVVVSAIVKAVVVTHVSGCFEGAVEKALHDRIRIIALDAEDNLDAVLREDVDGSRAHAARKDDGRSIPSKPRRVDSAAVFRRGADLAFDDGTARRLHGVEGEGLGAAEVLAESSLVQWDCDSHFPILPSIVFIAASARGWCGPLVPGSDSPYPVSFRRRGRGRGRACPRLRPPGRR